MNSLGAIATGLAFMSEPEDQVRLLTAYLNGLDPGERESAAKLLAAPPRSRRVHLSALRNLVCEAVGAAQFARSQDFVGDAAETIALLWDSRPGANRPPTPSDIMQGLAELGPTRRLPALRAWLDACDADGRHLLVRLVTGSFRPPASRHVLVQAFAESSVRYQPPAPATVSARRQQIGRAHV